MIDSWVTAQPASLYDLADLQDGHTNGKQLALAALLSSQNISSIFLYMRRQLTLQHATENTKSVKLTMSNSARTSSRLWNILCTLCLEKVHIDAPLPTRPAKPITKTRRPSVMNSKAEIWKREESRFLWGNEPVSYFAFTPSFSSPVGDESLPVEFTR